MPNRASTSRTGNFSPQFAAPIPTSSTTAASLRRLRRASFPLGIRQAEAPGYVIHRRYSAAISLVDGFL